MVSSAKISPPDYIIQDFISLLVVLNCFGAIRSNDKKLDLRSEVGIGAALILRYKDNWFPSISEVERLI